MKNYDLITPEGTKDLLFGECIIRRNIEDTLRGIFSSRGYSEIITPGLEFFDVFNLNSRYFPQENLYKLTDSKGRLLVMRPDSTMPIARVVATRLRDAILPLKLCYNQTVYRTEPALKGRSDEIVQAGIELIGSQLKMADLEVISTAIDSLKAFGMEFSLEIGHIGVFKELVGKLEVTDTDKERIRKLIESKNFPALNDLLDSFGSNPITAALKKLPALFGGVEVFDKAEGWGGHLRFHAAFARFAADFSKQFANQNVAFRFDTEAAEVVLRIRLINDDDTVASAFRYFFPYLF